MPGGLTREARYVMGKLFLLNHCLRICSITSQQGETQEFVSIDVVRIKAAASIDRQRKSKSFNRNT